MKRKHLEPSRGGLNIKGIYNDGRSRSNSKNTIRGRTRDRDLVTALEHGLMVLEAVAAAENEIPLSTLAVQVGLKKTSAWRLVHTLVELGYVRQNGITRRYHPAPRVLGLGHAYFERLDLKQLAAPFLTDLSAHFGETITLAVRDGDELVYLERISTTSHIININLGVGSRLPLFNTSMGRALICEMPDSWLHDYMIRLGSDQGAAKFLQAGERFLPRILSTTRKLGYAMNDEALYKGVRGIASPVWDSSGEIIAAVGVTVPASRVTMSRLRSNFAPEIIGAAQKISAALGYRKKYGRSANTRK
jgi:IclR family transcriptional regulator, pca regulon regulatory protein